MNTPSADDISDEAKGLVGDTIYLDQIALPLKLSSFLASCIVSPRRMLKCMRDMIRATPTNGLRDRIRLLYHLIEAGYLARQIRGDGYSHIHCHFINGPTSIGMFLAGLRDIPFSFTMHASMIWLDPIALVNKLTHCKFCASISEYNKNYVLDTYGVHFAKKIEVIHCGVDPEEDVLPSAGTSARRLELLGVGQLNGRKGFHILIEACGILNKESDLSISCSIVGGGAEFEHLEELIILNDLQEVVELVGPVKHEEIMRYLQGCDVFVLPCIVSQDGWRDGIPVALMEAMFHCRPVISTSILGLPELIDHGVNGLLVQPENPSDLAQAILEMARSPQRRIEMGRAGRDKVIREFNNLTSASRLARLFDA